MCLASVVRLVADVAMTDVEWRSSCGLTPTTSSNITAPALVGSFSGIFVGAVLGSATSAFVVRRRVTRQHHKNETARLVSNSDVDIEVGSSPQH